MALVLVVRPYGLLGRPEAPSASHAAERAARCGLGGFERGVAAAVLLGWR
jgi:hypothetical protein